MSGLYDAPGWRPGRKIRNDQGARPPRHRLRRPVPVRARITWADTGEEVWIDTVAVGWSGRLVKVDTTPIRPDYDVLYVWLDVSDVERR